MSDDGCGFDVGGLACTGAFGLISMRERANAIGARLQIRSTPGHGTEVRVTW